MRAPAAICALLLLPVALASCGDRSSGRPPGAEPAGWQSERLAGEPAVDFPALLVTSGDDALVLMLSDEGVLQSHLSTRGAAFEAGEPLDLGVEHAVLGDAVRLDDGSWFALGSAGIDERDGDEELAYDPLGLRSNDGLVWERTDVGGFTDAVEFNDLEVVDGRVVAVGDYRTAKDPGSGGFEGRVWTSDDGRAFDEVVPADVPDQHGYASESYIGDVVAVDGALLASGRIGDTAALWRSEDGGTTWTRVETPLLRKIYSISGLGAVGSTVVASTAGGGTSAIRSTDGGATWAGVDALPLDDESEGWAPLWSGADRFFTLVGIDSMAWSAPEVCYADLDQCGRNPDPQLVMSEDGAGWSGVEVPGGGELDELAGFDDGRVLVMSGEGSGVVVHTWPAAADLPAADEPALPETVELVTLAEGEEPEIGVRYHAPLYVHCGTDWLWLGDATWRRADDGPGVETGAGESAPDGWPLVEQQQTVYGYATVREDGVLEYTSEDGTVLATYERRSGAPGCD